jgi:methyl-accepting chemotaxis protein
MTDRLNLLTTGFVLAISLVVLLLLSRYTKEVIRDESVDITHQTLENIAQRIDNKLQLTDMTANLEQQAVNIDKTTIEKLIREGNYILALNQKLPNARLMVADNATTVKHDYRIEQHDGQRQYVFYQPVYNGRYGLVITFPVEDIYSRFTDMQIKLFGWGVSGILVLLIVLWWVIDHHLRPLHLLADSAQRINDGHLDETIPDSRQIDEIGQLQNSLSKMQLSLAAYMTKMKQDQAVLNRQIDALQMAYSEAQAYENLKAKFQNDMTNQMTTPVDTLCRHTDTICHHYQNLSSEKMTQLQVEIESATEAIVRLLDKLLNKKL